MRRLLAFLLLIGSLPAAGQGVPCTPVGASQITGADLARVIPAFVALSPDMPVAPSPLLGGTRIFRASELQQIADRNAIHTESLQEVCFKRATTKLDKDALLAAMRTSLRTADTRIDVAEFSAGLVPAGRVEFTLEGLVRPARAGESTPVLWNGSVVTDDNRHYPIWAKVRIVSRTRQLVATQDLKAGTAINAGQVRIDDIEGFPDSKNTPPSIEAVSGMITLRGVTAGSVIRMDNLKSPADVNRGDTVQVVVQFGATRIGLTGFAESTGRAGETIAIRNPATGRTFQARIESKNSVVVEPLWQKRETSR